MRKTEIKQSERRRAPRIAVDLPVGIVVAGKVRRCRLVNVSEGGVLIGGTHGIAVGATISVTITGIGPVEGRVIRVTDERVAIQFPRIIAISPILR